MAQRSAQQSCSVEDCPAAGPITRGLCIKHYRRLMRHGDPLHVTAYADRRTPDREPLVSCPIDGCSQPRMRSQEWCSLHYRRWVRNGDPTKLVKFNTQADQKRCPSCEQWLPLDDYWRASRGPSSRQSICKVCQGAVKARWQRENRERANDYSRARYAASRESELERQRKRRLAFPAEGREANRRYREKNPEKAIENVRAWQRRNPGKVTGYASVRRARRRSTSVAVIDHALIFDRDAWTCQLCDGPIDRSLVWPDPRSASLDHAIPLARGGTHTPDNVQASHLVCNMRKGARTPP